MEEEIIHKPIYSDAQKKASIKYKEKNKDKINEIRKAYYKKRSENDLNFVEHKRAKAREYYQKRKEQKNKTIAPINTDVIEITH